MLKRIGAEESGEFKAIASGTLPSGKPVIVNADGTVSVPTETTISENIGSATVFEAANTQDIASGFDSTNNKVVLAYMDKGNSNYGTAVVGSVSGNSISFGTPVVFNAGQTTKMNVVFDTSNDKIVITYKNDASSDNGTAIVGTVSGTSISFGTAAEFETSDAGNQAAVFDSSNNKVVILYRDGDNSNYGTAVIATVSGTSISFGTPVVFASSNLQRPGIGFDSTNNKVVIAYQDVSDSNKGKSLVGTVSGTSISFGSAVEFDSGALGSSDPSVLYDTNAQKIVIVYQDEYNSYKGAAIVGTVSGTSISFGTSVIFETGAANHIDAVYDAAAKKIVVAYRDQNNSEYGTVIVGTVSGTSISFGSSSVFESAEVEYCSVIFDSNSNKVVISYRDGGNSNYGTSLVYQTAYVDQNLTSENYIGMSRGPTGVTEPQTQAIGTPASYYTTAGTAYTTAVFDSNSNKVVFSFRGNGDDGTSIVGTVDPSNNSMSFGSAVVWNTDESIYIKSVFDSNSNKVVIVYRDEGNSQYGTAVVGTVSGNSISFGSDVVFESAAVDHIAATFDSSNNKVVIAFRDRGDNFYGKAIVGTVSGTSISFGSAVTFNSNSTIYPAATFDSNSNKVVISYFNLGGGSNGTSIVGTVSGTSISFGSAAEFESGNFDHLSSAFDSSNNKVVLAYRDEGNSNYGTAVVGTVSGTSISFGTPVVFESATVSGTGTTFDTTTNKINIFYTDDGNSGYATVIVGTVSGTSISFGTPVAFEDEDSGQYGATFDSNSNRAVCGYADNGNSSYGTYVVFKNAGDYPVTVQVADGGQASIDIIGSVSDNQLSLTAGQQYYVQTDGTISTTADSPSVLAGTAISATELLVKT